MRVDKFLKVSRILKRRSVAAEAASSNRVSVNGRNAKPGNKLKIGDVVEVTLGQNTVKFKVVSLNEKVRADESSSLYEILS
ncbi:MAG: RNA-binding S4 domain-containing protein [Firmicutes bacterium]|nr:RNA-binding S4 domain-containing protein [Bacillota bacterium]